MQVGRNLQLAAATALAAEFVVPRTAQLRHITRIREYVTDMSQKLRPSVNWRRRPWKDADRALWSVEIAPQPDARASRVPSQHF